jgi:hypothetical protein
LPDWDWKVTSGIRHQTVLDSLYSGARISIIGRLLQYDCPNPSQRAPALCRMLCNRNLNISRKPL